MLFEDNHGDGVLVSAKKLSEAIQKAEIEFDVVFLAACKSEEIGRIFQHCGARHVVCIKKNDSVLDEAAIQFTRTFYSLLFKGGYQKSEMICTAFVAAKQAVRF